ncbi:unnamed protein product, partial [Rotaria sp. Silwood2]
PYLNKVIRLYPNHRLNFKSILRSNFDLICQYISPDQVKILILSDEKDTSGQSELFLSHFQINQFINLQTLILIQIEKKSLEIINLHLNKLHYLRSLFLNSEITIPLSLPLVNLRYLKLSQYSLDQLKNICFTTPQLKTLNVTVIHRTSKFEFQCQLDYLTRLVLQIVGFHVSMDEIEKFLNNFSHLKHLELHTKCYADVVNGHRWKIVAKDLITLKFIFNIEVDSIEEILDTFRTSFWLNDKQWFVAYDNNHLFTIPCSMYKHVNEFFQPPKYTNILENTIFYDHVRKLTLNFHLIKTSHRFINITTLEIGYKYISVEILST